MNTFGSLFAGIGGLDLGLERETPELLPAESMALTVALAQVQRGDEVGANTAALCVLALARITGRYDWTTETEGQ